MALARPKLALALWGGVIAALAILGFGVDERLHRTSLQIDGSASQRAADLAQSRFGESSQLILLLEGPPSALRAQGREIAAALERRPEMTVLSPWLQGGSATLRPARNQALLLVRSERSFEETSRDVVPGLRRQIDGLVSSPVKAHLSGPAVVAAGLHSSSVEEIRSAELIAAPLLIVVLLLVFRSVVAAGLPLLVGITTIAAGSGLLELVNRLTPIDAFAMSMMSMMGLALGVDYALLLVSRFREELGAGAAVDAAIEVTVAAAGRTVLFAGAVLAAAMLAALFVAPGSILVSASVGVVVAVVMSLIGALIALPAMLKLLGSNIERWRLGRQPSGQRSSHLAALALRFLAQPVAAAGLVMLIVAVLALPALALESGPADPEAMPEDARERRDFMAVKRALGREWITPFQITVTTDDGPVTANETLTALDRWQGQLSRDPGVEAVMGPGPIANRAERVDQAQTQLADAEAEIADAADNQQRLLRGLDRAAAGARALQMGLGAAASGVSELAAGGEEAASGAEALALGLAAARLGGGELTAGLTTAIDGADQLSAGSADLLAGARRVVDGVERAGRGVGDGLQGVRNLQDQLGQGAEGLQQLRQPAQVAEQELAVALDGLEQMLATSKGDPQYQRVYRAVATALGATSGVNPLTGQMVEPGYDGLDRELGAAADRAGRGAEAVSVMVSELETLARGLGRLRKGSRALARGASRLHGGAGELVAGIERLNGGGGELVAGLDRLLGGADELSTGVDQLSGAAGALAPGLTDGAQRSSELVAGLNRIEDRVATARMRTRRLSSNLAGSRRLSETLDSGYFLLSGLDTASSGARRASTFAVNLDHGGTAAQVVVIGHGNVAADDHPLRPRLEHRADALAERIDGQVAVGGPAALVQDFDAETEQRFPFLVAVLCLVTFVILVPILRSLLLPFLAVVLNLLTVAASLGVLTFLFGGDNPLLGGTGVVDALTLYGVFGIVFGLSIDYAVFLLARMREIYDRTGSGDEAIAEGLRRTAGVITGAALIMTGVFLAFATAGLIPIRQLGIGLTVAVLLDATVIRLVLLPAAVQIFGRASWWLPAPLERLFAPGAAGANEAAGS